ncbi:trypsin-like peptidase domain-containing protein [Nonomuraea sp. NPDC050310]|uniref:S1C family serine protease n=1 Tax=unclassified Nonomuraea TaxID=2593643 RepID=UPI0033EB4EE7
MTDETRPPSEDGRTPSDTTERLDRPDFRPAESWGDPSGRPPTDTVVFGEQSGGPTSSTATSTGGSSLTDGYGPQPGTGGYARPDGGAPNGTATFMPPPGTHPTGTHPTAGPTPGGQPTGTHPTGGQPTGTHPAGGHPNGYANGGGAPGYGPAAPGYGPGASTSGHSTSGPGGFGSPGGPGSPPPPPFQASGMGPGWAPPPSGAHPGGTATAPRPGTSLGVVVVIAVVAAMLAATLGSVGTYLLTRNDSGNNPSYSLGPVPSGSTARPPDSVAGVASRVLPSVVSLDVGNGTGTEAASGSGFLIKGGYVVTNNHVVAMAAKGGEIRINFNNRKSTSARIIGRDAGSDLAVVKPDETFGTPEIVLGNSDQVVVGDPVIAVGSPLGLSGTVTTGIVSSLNRPVVAGQETAQRPEDVAYISAIQTDAAINPGNSGGPLVNVNGEVVGVNSAIATLGRSLGGESGNIGLGFAIPSNQARRVAEDIIKYGKAKRPRIGIVLDNDYRGQGVKIASAPQEGRQPVDAAGPAGKAGLKAGDVILEIDGLRLENGNELIALIRAKAPGSKVTVKYQRDGQEATATLTVMAEEEPVATPSPS